ncbi:MAG: hypothetical protein QM831_00505 [Kofleriaceae bacterium]
MRWLALVCVLARVASADDPVNPDAEKLFRDGREALKAGELAKACDAFAASSRLGPSVGAFLNLGDCRAKLGQVATAWGAFVEAGRLAKKLGDDGRAQEALRRATELEAQLSYITLEITARLPGEIITRDGVELDAFAWGQPFATDPGKHTFVATAPNYQPVTIEISVDKAKDRKTVKIPALVEIPRQTRIVTKTSVTPTFTRLRVGAVIAGGIGVIAGGVGLGYAIDAKILDNRAHDKCPDATMCHDQGASDDSKTAAHRANIATGFAIGSGVAVATGVVLWFVGKPHAETLTVAPTSSGASVLLGGSF